MVTSNILNLLSPAERMEHSHRFELELIRLYVAPSYDEKKLVRIGELVEFFENKLWRRCYSNKINQAMELEGYKPVVIMFKGKPSVHYNIVVDWFL